MIKLSDIQDKVISIKKNNINMEIKSTSSKIISRIINEFEPELQDHAKKGYCRYGKKGWPSDHGKFIK